MDRQTAQSARGARLLPVKLSRKERHIYGMGRISRRINGKHQIMEETMTTTITIDASKNCKGVGCPMNLVHAKVGLAKLQSGQILELILDDGAPINNVPGSVLKEGHRILEKRQLQDGTWRLLIQKA
jgi:TusA-related sulfurtransferase